MTTSVIFCLSYDLSKVFFLSPLKLTIFQRKMHCCHGCSHELLVPAESVNTRVVIILFIIYKVMKYRKIMMKYIVYFIFSLVKI